MPPIMPINPMDTNALQLWNALLGITDPNMVPETTVLQPPGTEPSTPMDSAQYAQLAQAVNADLPNPGQTFNGDAIPQEPIDQKGYPSMEAALAAQNSGPTGEPPMTPELLAASISPEGTGQGMTEPSLEQPESQGFQSGGLLQNLAMALAAAAPGLMFGARSAGAGGKSYSEELRRQDENRKLRMQQQQAEQKAILSAMTAMQGQQLRRDLNTQGIESRERVAGLNREAMGERTDKNLAVRSAQFNKSYEQKERLAENGGGTESNQLREIYNASVEQVNNRIDGALIDPSEKKATKLPLAPPGTSGKELAKMISVLRPLSNIVGGQTVDYMARLQQAARERAAATTMYKQYTPDVDKVAGALAGIYNYISDPNRVYDSAVKREILRALGDSRFSDLDVKRVFGETAFGQVTDAWNWIGGDVKSALTPKQWGAIKEYADVASGILADRVGLARAAVMKDAPNVMETTFRDGAAAWNYIQTLGSPTLRILPPDISAKYQARADKVVIKAAPVNTVITITDPKTGIPALYRKIEEGPDGALKRIQ